LRTCCRAALVAAFAVGCAQPSPSNRVFVSQAGSSTVAIIDTGRGEVERRIDVGMLPHNLLLSADRSLLYVSLVGSQAVAEIDTSTGRLRRTLLTAPVPDSRPDGTLIRAHFERDAFSHTTCYDCHRPGGAQPKYAGDRPFGLLLSPDGRRLLVSHLRSSAVAVLDLEAGRIERTVRLEPAGPATEAVALARLGDEIWVALRAPQPSSSAGVLRRLDAVPLDPLGDLATGSDPASLLALPNRGRVLVSNFETDSVTEHDPEGNARLHATAPGPLGLLALPSGEVLTVDYYSNAVSFLDLNTETSETVALEYAGALYVNPTNGALASDGRSAWLVSSGTDGHLIQLDLGLRRVIHQVPIDGLSFGVAVIPGVPW
jgi:DNA-binding beta-propeller fold protein YncE